MRFLPPVAALALGPTTFDGDEYARRRPMAGVIHGTAGARRRPRRRPPRHHAVHRARHRSVARRRARDRRVGVEPVRLRAAAVGRTLRARPRPAPFRRAAAEPAPHRDDHRDARRTRCRGRHAPRPGAGPSHPARSGASTSTSSPTSRTRRRSSSQRWSPEARSPSPAGRHETTQVGARLIDLLPRFGARVELDGDRLTVHAPSSATARAGASAASISTSPRPANSYPTSSRSRRSPTSRRPSRASATSATTRPTGSPPSPPSSTRLGGRVTELDDGLRIEPAPLHGGPGAPTPITAWPRPARSSDSPCPA